MRLHRLEQFILASAMLLSIAGCPSDNAGEKTVGAATPAAAEDVRLTNREPQFVVTNGKDGSKPDTVLVFVHGIFGDTVSTWRNSNGVGFFDLVNEDPEFRGRFDAFAFGFSSYYVSQGSFSIREAAKRLRLHADIHLKSYKRVIFVAHSMGGLVTMRYLLADPQMAKRVPVIVLFATPQEPAHVANVARHVLRNDALYEMSEAKENKFFFDLDDDWKQDGANRPEILCAFEKLQIGPVLVVSQLAATRYCSGATPTIGENHINIVKPPDRKHDSYLVLVRALRKHAMTPAPNISTYTEAEEREILKIEALVHHNMARFPSEALKDSQSLVANFPKYANGYRLVGVANWNQGEFEKALSAYESGLKLNPDPEIFFKLKLNRIACLLALGRLSQAQPFLADLAKDSSSDELVRVLVALERLLAGDFAGARMRFQELSDSTKLPGSLPFVKTALGFSRALGRSSDADDKEAANLWKQAIELEPKIRGVFSGSQHALMIEGWNYAIFRKMFEPIRARPMLRKVTS